MKALVISAVAAALSFSQVALARSYQECDEYAFLHYAMAESFDGDADAAYEDAFAYCAGEEREALEYEQAQRDFAERFPECAAGGVRQIAGGWEAFCEEM